ncbi:hypothetical protein [Pseudomonas kitaguniensis]|uniref:hypothetical protein n=1 Tax=Pseudomonas kitaguniensis TaxID=2607908 RepID=UPI003D00217B
MSYLDEEIIEDFKKNKTKLTILSESEHDLIVKKINDGIPFSMNSIAWNLLKDSVYLGANTSIPHLTSLIEKIKFIAEADVIIVGDSTDNAYSISTEDLLPALQIFSTIPQHTYITQKSMTWIAGISFEGNIYFSTL